MRLCFQVFLEGTEKGAFTFALRPVVSDPIYDKSKTYCNLKSALYPTAKIIILNDIQKTTTSISESRSDLTICRMTECSASVTGGKEIMLFCDKVSKDDIQIQFYEESKTI